VAITLFLAMLMHSLHSITRKEQCKKLLCNVTWKKHDKTNGSDITNLHLTLPAKITATEKMTNLSP